MNCLFSGEEADTKEHVIPLWLQNRMQLQHKHLMLPNSTALPYKNVVVPAKLEHNKKFSEIETRISKGIFNPEEVYLWAMKIHIGLLYKDSSLALDRKNPKSIKIGDLWSYEAELMFFRMLYQNWKEGGTTIPSPLGSVYILDSPTPEPAFDLMHCNITKILAIDIGSKLIYVNFWDRKKPKGVIESWKNHHLRQLNEKKDLENFNDFCFIARRIWVCESAYGAHLMKPPKITFLKKPKSLMLVQTVAKKQKQHNETDYTYICNSFGLNVSKISNTNQYSYEFLKKTI